MATRFVPAPSAFDRIVDEFFAGRPRMDRQIPLDAFNHDGTLVLAFDLPGVPEDRIELSVERRVLTVRAERTYAPAEGDQVMIAERPWGAMSRQVVLGENLDLDRVQAHAEHGVLWVRIPVAERAKGRRIEIGHAPVSTGSIETKSHEEPGGESR
jgi:HSP20 family protein